MTLYANLDADRFVIGFYSDDFHAADQIPATAVAITEDQHKALLDGQSSGKRMALDASGAPLLIDPNTLVSLADAKTNVKTMIRAKRDALLLLTPFNGKDFQTDLASKIQIMNVVDAGSLPAYAAYWRTADNSYMPMTFDLFVQLKTAIMAREGAAFGASAHHQDAVDALTAAADVLAYDYSTGWPT
jgi:hypothetical protein